MALIIKPATLNTELNNLNNTINNVIKPATINEHNLSLNDLNNALKHVIKTRTTTPKIKDLINIYEQSTRASTTQETTPSETTHSEEQQGETTPINPTKELIRFLINRNRADATRLNLTHFKNIRCKDNNNKSCIIPIYKTPEDRRIIKHIEENENNLIVLTLNKIYSVFIPDIYNINYTELLNRMATRYKLEVRPYNTIL
jgi:hypothetical protein